MILDGMSPKLTTASSGRQGMMVPLLVWIPLTMTMVFITQSIFVMYAAYFLLIFLFSFSLRSISVRRLRAMLSGSFNGEAWLLYVRGNVAYLAIIFLIIPISIALSFELSIHAVLSFKDALHLDTDLNSIAHVAEVFVPGMSTFFLFFLPFVFMHGCLVMKPEGGTATQRQLLFIACLVVVLFIYLIGAGGILERIELMSLKISGKELSDPVAHTLHVVLLSIVVLVACYCYFKICIVLFENIVTKDKKLQQFRRTMFKKGLLENEPAIKEKQGMLKLLGVKMLKSFGAIERGGLLSVIVANSACLLAIAIYLVM